MKCSELQNDTSVVFYIYSDIYKRKIPMDGTVVGLNLKRKEVIVSYLEGYKDMHEYIPYKDMIAAYDENGEYMVIENIKGNGVPLIAE